MQDDSHEDSDSFAPNPRGHESDIAGGRDFQHKEVVHLVKQGEGIDCFKDVHDDGDHLDLHHDGFQHYEVTGCVKKVEKRICVVSAGLSCAKTSEIIC